MDNIVPTHARPHDGLKGRQTQPTNSNKTLFSLSPQSNVGSPNSANGLSPSDGDPQSSQRNSCIRQKQKEVDGNADPATLIQIVRETSPDAASQDDEGSSKPQKVGETKSIPGHLSTRSGDSGAHSTQRGQDVYSCSYANAANPELYPYMPAAGQGYKPYYYPAMPKGYESPSALPSLLPIRQLECPPPSRSLSEQKSDVVGGAIEGRLCRGITLTRVEIRNSYLVNCTLINCISKGCYFTSTRLFASDIVNAPCVISCSLEDSFISLSILSNCKMLQGAVKESRIMDCDIEAAGVFYCRLTRSIFYQCEYKEIEQVDCDLRECDGNGDVDAFFPIVPPPPPKASRMLDQHGTLETTAGHTNPKIMAQPQCPQQTIAYLNNKCPNPKADVSSQRENQISAPLREAKSNLCDNPSSEEIFGANNTNVIKTLNAYSQQQQKEALQQERLPVNEISNLDAPASRGENEGKSSNPSLASKNGEPDDYAETYAAVNQPMRKPACKTAHQDREHRDGMHAKPRMGEKTQTRASDVKDDVISFNKYFREQNEHHANTKASNVRSPISTAPYPDPHEPKVGGRGRRGSMFCCQ